MINSFSPPPPNKTIEFKHELPINNGGSGRYIYNLNCGDQTVSVIDGNSDSVITTIVLSSGRSFSSLHYRALDQSVYVLGNLYFDRIDADESSGTFNTIVQSGASLVDGLNASYLCWPIDVFTHLGASNRWVPVKYINNAAEAAKDYNWASSDSVIRGQIVAGHHFGRNSRIHPRSNILELSSNQRISVRFGNILTSSKQINVNSPYMFTGHYHPSDLDSDNVASYVFGNFRLCTTGGSGYLVHSYDYSNITFVTNLSFSNGLYFTEYCPNAKRFFWSSKITYVRTQAFDIGRGVYSSVGTLDRAAYKATNEDATDDMMYCPYNGKLYVQGKRHSSLTTGVNKLHVYDPTQSLANMYQTSITVGEMASTLRHGNYSVNTLCMNRTRYWEAPEVIY